MDNSKILVRTESFVKHKLSFDNSGHDYWHVMRVFNIATLIAEQEDADLAVVQIAALLHDIGDHGPAAIHTKSCAKVAREFLEQLNLDSQFINHVSDCILTHSWSDEVGKPETLEAKIIADADALEAAGAIGVIRTSQYYSAKGMPIHDPNLKPNPKFDKQSTTMVNHFYEKLLLLDKSMYTKTAKSLAEERVKFMKFFLNEFLAEWEGKR